MITSIRLLVVIAALLPSVMHAMDETKEEPLDKKEAKKELVDFVNLLDRKKAVKYADASIDALGDVDSYAVAPAAYEKPIKDIRNIKSKNKNSSAKTRKFVFDDVFGNKGRKNKGDRALRNRIALAAANYQKYYIPKVSHS